MTQLPTREDTITQARNEIKRRIQQMLSSGEHSADTVKDALADILENWK